TCLKYLLPISCALFLGVAIWPLAVFKLTGRSTLVNSLKVMGTDIGRPMSERSFVPGVPQARHAGPVEAQATPVAPAPQGTDRAGAELRVPAAPTLVPAAADKVSSS
ncbi:MAG: hypothetical protein ACK5HA_05895, partial [Planctomycetaceae bacterium]